MQLILARLLESFRDRSALYWSYVFPLVMLSVLGIAFKQRATSYMAVAVQQGAGAEGLVATLSADDRFRVLLCSREEARRALRSAKVDLLITVHLDQQERYQYYFDPTKPTSVHARNAVDDVVQRAAGRTDVVLSKDCEATEPGSGRYVDFLVPGLLGIGVMGCGLWGVGYTVVDLRLRKLLMRFFATPMKKSHFLAAIMLSRLFFTICEVFFIVLISFFLFGTVNQGSYFAIAVLLLLGAFQFTGIGLLVASRTQTLETASGILNAVMLPMWLVSGTFFSSERFPEIFQPLIKILPLTILIDSVRSVMLEGIQLTSLSVSLALMVVWGIVPFILALRWFRWS